jgi:hypothetical protein
MKMSFSRMGVLKECVLTMCLIVAVRLLHAVEEDIYRSAGFVFMGQCNWTDFDSSDIISESSQISDTQCISSCVTNCQCFAVDHCQIDNMSKCYQRRNATMASCKSGTGCERWAVRVSMNLFNVNINYKWIHVRLRICLIHFKYSVDMANVPRIMLQFSMDIHRG